MAGRRYIIIRDWNDARLTEAVTAFRVGLPLNSRVFFENFSFVKGETVVLAAACSSTRRHSNV